MNNTNKLKLIKKYIDEVGIVNVEDLKGRFNLSSGELELVLIILEELNVKKVGYNIVKCSDCKNCKLNAFCSFKGGSKNGRSDNEKVSRMVGKIG